MQSHTEPPQERQAVGGGGGGNGTVRLSGSLYIKLTALQAVLPSRHEAVVFRSQVSGGLLNFFYAYSWSRLAFYMFMLFLHMCLLYPSSDPSDLRGDYVSRCWITWLRARTLSAEPGPPPRSSPVMEKQLSSRNIGSQILRGCCCVCVWSPRTAFLSTLEVPVQR